MGIGESGQIYKEAEKQKLIHVEAEQTQQSQKQGQSQSGQMQQKKTDLLENLMQKYQENASQVDLSEVKKEQPSDMEEQIVATTSIHETKNAELILEGKQLSQNKQEQINRAEQQMKEETEHQESQEQSQTKQLPPAYRELAELNRELQADTDSASKEFRAVKTAFAKLMEVMSAEHVIVKYQQDALFEARQAAVHYYNTHRGHRWSKKGKNRKDLINRMIDCVQQAVNSEDTPKLVKFNVLFRIMSDSSPEGFESKKTKEFANAEVPKLAGHKRVDEYSYRIYCQIMNKSEEAKEAERLYDINKQKALITTGLHDVRTMMYYAKSYQVNEQGEPLTEQDMQIKQKGEAFYKAMKSEDIRLRKPILDDAIQSILDVKFDRKMAEPGYFLEHYEEVNEMMLCLWYGDVLFSEDRMNRQYMDQLPETVKQQMELRRNILQKFSAAFAAVVTIKGVTQKGEFDEVNKDFIKGKPKMPSYAKEFIKKGRIMFDPDEDLSDDNPEFYKTKDGYVKPDNMINNLDYSILTFIEELQNTQGLVKINLQEELRKAGMA